MKVHLKLLQHNFWSDKLSYTSPLNLVFSQTQVLNKSLIFVKFF